MKRSITAKILKATEEAAKAVRIDHRTALMKALAKREKLIAELFGFDPDQPLPEFVPGKSKEPVVVFNKIDRINLNHTRTVEESLFAAWSSNGRRLIAEEGRLRRGERYLHGMRDLNPAGNGKRFDCKG